MVESSASFLEAVVERVRLLAREWDRENGDEQFPAERMETLGSIGALDSFVVLDDVAAVDALASVLRSIGGADLSLGRVFEGHVNAAQLVHAYGSAQQRETLASELAARRVYGVWNTEPAPVTLAPKADGEWQLVGAKSFATGAGHIDSALITARLADGSKQLVLVPVAEAAERVDNSGWRVRACAALRAGSSTSLGWSSDPRR